jgi:predicted P-loop ATPase
MDTSQTVAAMIEGDSEILTSAKTWKSRMLFSENGSAKPLLANAIVMLRDHPEMQGLIRFDDFAARIILIRPAPWDLDAPSRIERAWTSNDDIHAANWLQRRGIAVNVSITEQAITAVADGAKYNPVAAYLDKLQWDKEPRLSTWLSEYLGVEHDRYVEAVGRCSLIAAVARIRQPGCKVDTIPILEGAQGVGKSTALRLLFEPWFTDELADLGSKDAAMQLDGAWLIEISELDAMSRSDVGRVKAFASRTTDRFRPPYGRRVIEKPRSCVFWGTTNSEAYLKDETGARRFWPIRVSAVNAVGLKAIRDQLWAEAQVRYDRKEAWWLGDNEVRRAAVDEQQARYVGDPWDLEITSYVATRTETSVTEILADVIRLPIDKQGQIEMNRVARCLKSNGWERFQVRVGDERAYRYRRERK